MASHLLYHKTGSLSTSKLKKKQKKQKFFSSAFSCSYAANSTMKRAKGSVRAAHFSACLRLSVRATMLARSTNWPHSLTISSLFTMYICLSSFCWNYGQYTTFPSGSQAKNRKKIFFSILISNQKEGTTPIIPPMGLEVKNFFLFF